MPVQFICNRIIHMNITSYIEDNRKKIDGFLKKYISAKKGNNDCPKELAEAMSYALMAGGKRVRPILAIASYEAVGGRSKGILNVASALELIHTYSLVHDDLPAMDDDDLRRNKPTTHRVFGEATAILAGDALLTDAFHIISTSDGDPKKLITVIEELSHACGPEGMVGGQEVDILLEGKKGSKQDVLYIHTHKTGAFIRGAVRVGALMGGASRKRLDALTEYGEKTGLAFQVIDDILDITGTRAEIGKSTGADAAKGKNTYPSAFGLEKSREIADNLIKEAVHALADFNKNADPLREIARYILSRRN